MTEVRLKYLHSFRDRHGHVRFYFRYRGNRWPLPDPYEEGFATAYDALLTEIKSNPIQLPKNLIFMRGSLGWVIEQFIASPAYQTRAEATAGIHSMGVFEVRATPMVHEHAGAHSRLRT